MPNWFAVERINDAGGLSTLWEHQQKAVCSESSEFDQFYNLKDFGGIMLSMLHEEDGLKGVFVRSFWSPIFSDVVDYSNKRSRDRRSTRTRLQTEYLHIT